MLIKEDKKIEKYIKNNFKIKIIYYKMQYNKNAKTIIISMVLAIFYIITVHIYGYSLVKDEIEFNDMIKNLSKLKTRDIQSLANIIDTMAN